MMMIFNALSYSLRQDHIFSRESFQFTKVNERKDHAKENNGNWKEKLREKKKIIQSNWGKEEEWSKESQSKRKNEKEEKKEEGRRSERGRKGTIK